MRFLALLAALQFAGCSAKNGENLVLTDAAIGANVDLGAPPLCTPGAQVACACPGGTASVQLCQANGTLGPCGCAAAKDAGVDAGHPDGGVAACQFNYQCGLGRLCIDGCCRTEVHSGTCQPTRPYCEENADCVTGETCWEGACRVRCSTAADCMRIDVQYTVCGRPGDPVRYCYTRIEVSPQCARNADCASGSICIGARCERL
jgi:hypothetical protein